MTDNERAILRYLAPLMEANMRMMAEHLGAHPSVAAGLCGSLRRKGLIMPMPELAGWRLTKAGREWVKENGT